MVRKGRYKYHHYVDYEPELYDTGSDPFEATNLAGDSEYEEVCSHLNAELLKICDPDEINAAAKRDQIMLKCWCGLKFYDHRQRGMPSCLHVVSMSTIDESHDEMYRRPDGLS